MRVMTVGRFMVANPNDAEVRGHRAAMGYFDSLQEACEFAHSRGCRTAPLAVYDSELPRDYYIKNQEVHRTH